MIRGAKGYMELLREANAAKAQYFCWVKRFVVINNLLVYRDFKSLEETQVVSYPCMMFDDIFRCHVHDTQHAGRVSTDAKV
jgi:hypothetical protein